MQKILFALSMLLLTSLVTLDYQYHNGLGSVFTEKYEKNESVKYNEMTGEEDTFSIPISDIQLLMNKEITGLIYFGRDSCPFCALFNGLMKEELQKIDEHIVVYKFDTDVWREHALFQEVLDSYNVKSIPALVRSNEDETVDLFSVSEEMTDEAFRNTIRSFLNNAGEYI